MRPTPRTLALASTLACLATAMGGCSESAEPGGSAGATSVGGSTSPGTGGEKASGAGPTTTGGGPAATGGMTGTPPGTGGQANPQAGGGGVPAATGGTTAAGGTAGGAAPTAGAGGASAGSGGGLPLPEPKNLDHCLYGYEPLPSDETMKSGPALYDLGGGKTDTILQPEVLQWMEDNKWMGAHVVWHAVRGCTSGTAGGLLGPLGFPNICRDYPVLIPTDQNCRTSGDGYQFLLFHRHMIETLKQLWPKHAADFDGFPKFPTSKSELPEVWNQTDPTWNAQILEAANIADNIDQHLDKFPDEGSVGYWLQCPVGAQAPGFAPQMPYIGLHFNLHDEWSRGASSAHGLNNGQVNITNYMFWKLHGWIDKVWEKYRVAKGLTKEGSPEMQKYRQDLAAQCREMDIEIEILKTTMGSGPMLDCPPDVDETGEFHTKVRPILENDANHCAACHGPAQTSPYAGLTLGGSISSKCVVERLTGRTANGGGQFKLIEPGDPDKSWLYLKASGNAAAAGCMSTDPNKPCNTATMPPSGRTMTDAELAILRQWIVDGAMP